jgi:hypothetical protein
LTGTSDSHLPECVIPDDVLIKFGPPDDEHLPLETCRGIRNKYIKKECIKLVINQNYVRNVIAEINSLGRRFNSAFIIGYVMCSVVLRSGG